MTTQIAKSFAYSEHSLKNIIVSLLEIINKDDVYHIEKTKNLLALIFLEIAHYNEDKHTQTDVLKNENEYYRSIYEVAEKVGYNSYEVFYKAYTGFFGTTPGKTAKDVKQWTNELLKKQIPFTRTGNCR